MKPKNIFFVAMLFLIVSCHKEKSGLQESNDSQKIINGQQVQSFDPIAKHTVLIHYYEMTSGFDTKPNQVFVCSGVIVGKKSVLTAAHCFKHVDPNKMSFFDIYFTQSMDDVESAPKTSAGMVSRHPFFKEVGTSAEPHFDLMMIDLRDEIPAGFEPISILPLEVELKKGDLVISAGFGITNEYRDSNRRLNKSKGLKIMEDWGTYFLMDQTQGSGVCSGDSGGPTFYSYKGKFYLVGIHHGAIGKDPKQPDFCHYQGATSKVQTHKAWILGHVKN